jgi:hypothetical protein
MSIVMWDVTQECNGSTVCLHVISIYLLFVLYVGLMWVNFNPKHANRLVKECNLCFRLVIYLFFVVYSVKTHRDKTKVWRPVPYIVTGPGWLIGRAWALLKYCMCPSCGMYRVTGNYARNFHPRGGVLSSLYCSNDVTKRAPRMADGSGSCW